MDGDGLAANPLQMQPDAVMQQKRKRRQGGPGKPFLKGASGNPFGKRPGSRNRVTIIAEEMLDCEVRALTRKVLEMALSGDAVAMRLCLDRIIGPRRERPLRFDLPPIETAADLHAAMAAITAAVSAATPTSPCGSSRASTEKATRGRNERISISDFILGNLETAGRRDISQPADLRER